MKTIFKITIIVIAIVTYALLGVTSTDEAAADVSAHDAKYTRLINEVGENAAYFLMKNR